MRITNYLKKNTLYLDGGMGTLLQEKGLAPGEAPELWNLSHPDEIERVHTAYFNAGSNVINTNTFGASCLKYTEEELDAIVGAAMQIARRARDASTGTQPKWIALDIGPTGRMLRPYGDLDFEDAVEIFAKTVRLGVKHGADLIFIETVNDTYETKAALLAAKENSSLPVFVSNAYGEDGKLMTGAEPAAVVAMLEGMGADAIGVNCSYGPKALEGVVSQYLRYASLPILFKPNAGMPVLRGTRTCYDVDANAFAEHMASQVARGVRGVGGCCGTTPAYIRQTVEASANIAPLPLTKKQDVCVSSYTHAVFFEKKPILIGERINPTGKKRLKEALHGNDIDYVLREGIAQEEKGAHILDVNVGTPDVCEETLLCRVVAELQAVTALPLQIDTANAAAMERALRVYNGKPMINSVNGTAESMRTIFPLAKKYGGLIVALTLDEGGIPKTAEQRITIAKKIVKEAAKYGISKKDLIFDPLAMAVSADAGAAKETLIAVERIGKELGCRTSLGVSNVSFGLPSREAITSTFFAMALERGLSAAILNPHSLPMQKVYHAFCALNQTDERFASYLSFCEGLTEEPAATAAVERRQAATEATSYRGELQRAIGKGLCESAAEQTRALLQSTDAMQIVQEHIIPALNAVGEGFESKKIYLPQLLMSAEAAKTAFEVIKASLTSERASNGCRFVIATVKGDVHDIGKNIVKLLLENYGFEVTDLGKDVPPERIVEEAVRQRADIVGLSALMTTTLPAMEETLALLRQRAPQCKTVVGGAVLTREYAERIGADRYAKDAMETVRFAEEINAARASADSTV